MIVAGSCNLKVIRNADSVSMKGVRSVGRILRGGRCVGRYCNSCSSAIGSNEM